MSDTPISDEASWKGEYGDDYSPDVVPLEVARNLERENNALRDSLSEANAKISQLRIEWIKYRLALNRIVHPVTFGINEGFEREIARRALVIGMDIAPLPKGAEIKPN